MDPNTQPRPDDAPVVGGLLVVEENTEAVAAGPFARQRFASWERLEHRRLDVEEHRAETERLRVVLPHLVQVVKWTVIAVLLLA